MSWCKLWGHISKAIMEISPSLKICTFIITLLGTRLHHILEIWIYETEFQFHYLLQSWQWAWRKFMQTLYRKITQRFLFIQYFELDLTIYPNHIHNTLTNYILLHHQILPLHWDTMNISIIYYHLHKTKNIYMYVVCQDDQ